MIDLVTAAELCSRMKIGKDRLRTLMSTPDFPKPVEKLKPKLYFREADVAEWLSGEVVDSANRQAVDDALSNMRIKQEHDAVVAKSLAVKPESDLSFECFGEMAEALRELVVKLEGK